MSGDQREEIVAIFRDALGIDVPSYDADVIETGLLDSLGLITLLYEIEQRFGVQIPFEALDLDDFRSVDALAGLVAAQAS